MSTETLLQTEIRSASSISPPKLSPGSKLSPAFSTREAPLLTTSRNVSVSKAPSLVQKVPVVLPASIHLLGHGAQPAAG